MQPWLYLLIFGVLFLMMMRGGCGSHVMGHGHGGHGATPDPNNKQTGTDASPPAEAVDPVCGMKVATASARSSLFQGKVYYFCSADCREKFEASPASFLGKTPTPMEHRHG